MIDYKNIFLAASHYENNGYKLIEVPWMVSETAIDITKPSFCRSYSTFGGELVGSGEQSFLQLMLENKLPPGKYACITPCFRDEIEDELHKKHFIKLELINTEEVDRISLGQMMSAATVFFNKLGIQNELSIEGDSYDIICAKTGIELGSYGIRRYKDLLWVYGTGCAEPRTSTVIRKIME